MDDEIVIPEVMVGLLMIHLAASNRKVKAGLRNVATGHPLYGDGVLELGVALDAIDMLTADVWRVLAANAEPLTDALMAFDADEIAARITEKALDLLEQTRAGLSEEGR